jgi:hypothetical protein
MSGNSGQNFSVHVELREDIVMNPVSLEGKKGLVIGIANEQTSSVNSVPTWRSLI